MEIKSTIVRPDVSFDVVYRDFDSVEELGDRKISAVHAYCFYENKLVVVLAGKLNRWTPPGGGVDGNETPYEAVVREVKEETNMKVVKHAFIGYQDINEPGNFITQTRSICIVEPYGDFEQDPDDGEITEVKLIDPKDYKEYFDWGEIGDHIMKRALELLPTLEL